MYAKKRGIDIEMPAQTIIGSIEEKHHMLIKPEKEGAVWVEKLPFKLNSTMGSGGADLHVYRKEKRWERNEQWYEDQNQKKNEVNNEYIENKERVNEILSKISEKKRMKRLKKKNKKGKLKEEEKKENQSKSEEEIEDCEI